MNTPLQIVIDALQHNGIAFSRTPNGFTCCCPAHDDEKPSLSIAENNGKVILHCHAGCQPEEVVKALGLNMSDLFVNGESKTETPILRASDRGYVSGKSNAQLFETFDDALADIEKRYGQSSASWPYHNANGEVVAWMVRFDFSEGNKEFRPISKIDDGWAVVSMPIPRLIYNLPEVLKSKDFVLVCEGEKAAEAARALGFVATTSSHGSNSVNKTDWTPLAGRDVVIVPDHDEPGRKYGDKVAEQLQKLSPPARIRRVDLSKAWPDLPKGGDLADLLAMERDVVQSDLQNLIDEAELLEPEESSPIGLAWHPFPLDALPDVIAAYVRAQAEAIGCDPAYIAPHLLAALAASIGMTRRIQLKIGWEEPAILWMAVVADSGTMKSPAMASALFPVQDKQASLKEAYDIECERYEEELLNYKALSAQANKDENSIPPDRPSLPVFRRLVTEDATIESIASLLNENPRGLLCQCDELAGWFGNFDRYSKSKVNGDVARWLTLYGGRILMVDRKSHGPIIVNNAAVCVTGCIQPGVFAKCMSADLAESGLQARLFVAMPPKKQKRWNESVVSQTLRQQIIATFEKLWSLDFIYSDGGKPIPRNLSLSGMAKDMWVSFYNEHGRLAAAESGEMAAAFNKLEGGAARLALVIHLSRWASGESVDPNAIDHVSMAKAIVLTKWWCHETRRVYAYLQGDGTSFSDQRLLDFIQTKGGQVTARDLQTSNRKHYPTAKDAKNALDRLEAAGHGKWSPKPTNSQGGRPTSIFTLHT